MAINKVGDGKVYLIAGGGKTYTDVAAKFCRSEKEVEEIIASPQSKKLIKNIISSNHKAALEFDDFIFGVELYSRVTEAQLIRKRHASYMISSGRDERKGKRSFDVTIPESIENVNANMYIPFTNVRLELRDNSLVKLYDAISDEYKNDVHSLVYNFDTHILLDLIEVWYISGLEEGVPEEDLRYLKPEATCMKACIKMNAAGLRDWFMIRMCNRAQTEIRDLATKIYKICVEVTPELFEDAGPSCKVLGYCPETEQCSQCNGNIPTKQDIIDMAKVWRTLKSNMDDDNPIIYKHYKYQTNIEDVSYDKKEILPNIYVSEKFIVSKDDIEQIKENLINIQEEESIDD